MDVFGEIAGAIKWFGGPATSSKMVEVMSQTVFPDLVLSLDLDLLVRRQDADDALSKAQRYHGFGSQWRLRRARWKCFRLSEAYVEKPCSRSAFDHIWRVMEDIDFDGSFREFYAEWNNADTTLIVGGRIKDHALHRLHDAIADSILAGSTRYALNEAVYRKMRVHPNDRGVVDLVIWQWLNGADHRIAA